MVEDNKDLVSELRVIAAAKRYAAADRSDPFALARALSHTAFGICGYLQDGRDCWYNAVEKREADGTLEYTVRVRP